LFVKQDVFVCRACLLKAFRCRFSPRTENCRTNLTI
jgi:hypothetical protein